MTSLRAFFGFALCAGFAAAVASAGIGDTGGSVLDALPTAIASLVLMLTGIYFLLVLEDM